MSIGFSSLSRLELVERNGMHLFIRFLNYRSSTVCGIYSQSPIVGIRIDSNANFVLNCGANEISDARISVRFQTISTSYRDAITEKEDSFWVDKWNTVRMNI